MRARTHAIMTEWKVNACSGDEKVFVLHGRSSISSCAVCQNHATCIALPLRGPARRARTSREPLAQNLDTVQKRLRNVKRAVRARRQLKSPSSNPRAPKTARRCTTTVLLVFAAAQPNEPRAAQQNAELAVQLGCHSKSRRVARMTHRKRCV